MSRRRRTRWRWAFVVGVTFVGLLIALYTVLTDPARLRARILAALQTLPFEGIDLAEATYSPWTGLELSDLTIDRESGSLSPPGLGAAALTPLLHVGSARIRCSLAGLLLGRVRPTDIELRHVAATVVCEPAGDAGESAGASRDADLRLFWEFLHNTPGLLPNLTIAQADLQLLVVERDQPQLLRRLLLRAAGQATAAGYELRVDRRPAKDEALAELRWDRGADTLTLALDWIEVQTVARFLPPRATDMLARLDLSGRARLDALVLRPNSGGDAAQEAPLAAARLSLADVGCTLPLEADSSTRPADCYLQLTGAAATLSYVPSAAQAPAAWQVTMAGRVRGAPSTFNASVDAAALKRLWFKHAAAITDESAYPAFTLDDVLRAELNVDGLELPKAETHPGFIKSPRLTGPVVAAFREYEPHGPVDLRLRVLPRGTRAADGAPLSGAARIEGEIEPRGAGCRYRHFPYDFEDARGVVRLSRGQILIDNLCGRHGGGRVCATGVVNDSHSWSGVDIQFLGQSLALDGELYAALPEQYRQLWQQAAPLGLCDIATHVYRAEGSAETGPLTADVQVDAHLLSGSISLGADRRLDHADGWLSAHNGLVQVRNLHGYDGDAAVQLDGEVQLVDGETRANLRVAVRDLPVDYSAALPFASAAEPPRIALAGRADALGRVFDAGTGDGREQTFAVHLKEGVLRGLDPQRAWDVAEGWIRVHDELQEILSLTCTQGAARLSVAGTLPSAAQQDRPIELRLQATTPAVEELGPQFVPGDWARLIADIGLAGEGEVAVRLHPEDAGPATVRQAATIAVQAARMKSRPLPLELRNVNGDLTLRPGRFWLRHATAEWGHSGQVLVEQTQEGIWESGSLEATFDVAARNLRFCPELTAALPQPLAQLLEKLSAEGEFDAFLPTVQVSGAEPRAWRLEGRLPLRNVALHLGLDLRIAEGELSGVCSVAPDRAVMLDAAFRLTRGQLADRPIESWEGQLRYRPGERWVRLENINGRLADGAAQGLLQIDPASSEYELALTLYDVSVDQMLPRPKDQPQRSRAGRLDGEIWLRGRGQDVASRRGGGNLRITGVSFLQTPVLSSVFSIFRQRQQPVPNDLVQQARVRFVWEGRELRLERVAIESQDLRLIGEGTWNMRDDTVRMTLWGARPENWPHLGVLSDLLESAGQELVQYRVEGTLAAPKVTTKPLYRLNAALRRLLGEENGS